MLRDKAYAAENQAGKGLIESIGKTKQDVKFNLQPWNLAGFAIGILMILDSAASECKAPEIEIPFGDRDWDGNGIPDCDDPNSPFYVDPDQPNVDPPSTIKNPSGPKPGERYIDPKTGKLIYVL